MTQAAVLPPRSIAIRVADDFGDEWRKQLIDVLGAEAIADMRADPEELDSVRYVVAWGPQPGYLARFKNLQAVFSAGAGVDHLMRDPLLPDVPIVRYVDPDMTARMGEWIMLHVLALHRGVLTYAQQQRDKVWREHYQPACHELNVGVMGLGVLGAHACGVLRAVGYNVLGWSRSAKSLDGVDVYVGNGELASFLANTDILVCLLPLTPDTKGLISASFLQQLGSNRGGFGPYLVNAGRGGLQIEADILAALDNGDLAGAALDVFEAEPLPVDSPVWTHPKIIMTPHVAAVSTPTQLGKSVRAGIVALLRGELPRNRVERSRGY